MTVPLVIGILIALAGFAHNSTGIDPNDVAARVVSCGILFGMFYFFKRENEQREEFFNYLFERREQLMHGGIPYGSLFLRPDTELIQYGACCSCIVFTEEAYTNYYLAEADGRAVKAFICNVITLLCGWWAFPYGPFKTIKILSDNLRGGTRRKIADFFPDLTSST